MKCQICGEEGAENYYTNEYSTELICEDCLLEIDGITTSTITNYFLDGEFIGDDSENIQEVINEICDNLSYKRVEV